MRLPPAPPFAERPSERQPVNSLQDISKSGWFPPAAEYDEGGDDEDEDVVSAQHDQGDGGGVVHVGEWLLRSAAYDPSVSQSVFTTTEKAPTRAYYWLKVPTTY